MEGLEGTYLHPGIEGNAFCACKIIFGFENNLVRLTGDESRVFFLRFVGPCWWEEVKATAIRIGGPVYVNKG